MTPAYECPKCPHACFEYAPGSCPECGGDLSIYVGLRV